MLRLQDTHIKFFKSLLGQSLHSCTASRMSIYDNSVQCYQDICLNFRQNKNFTHLQFNIGTDFIEKWEAAAQVYHNYDLQFERNNGFNAEIILNASIQDTYQVVTEILIYGRKFNADEFIDWPNTYQEFKDVTSTDDIFIFNCKDGKKVMIEMEYFAPFISLHFEKGINWRLQRDDFAELYQLHHHLKL